MSDTPDKRRYRNSLDFVAGGFRASWRNANDLLAASKNLIEQGLHAPALSLAVLALEEVGKLCAIDGLLFAQPDDHKSHRFGTSQRDHDTKLDAITLLPLFITNLSHVDPRRKIEQAYVEALAISLHQLQADGNAVLQPLQQEGFAGLNKWKQRGFYVGIERNAFMTPREAVDQKFAEAVHHFAWRAISTLDFVLKDGNLGRYIEQARSIRDKLAERDHKAFEEIGQQVIEILFSPEDNLDTEN
jgi:AbiV family abortive infection protein